MERESTFKNPRYHGGGSLVEGRWWPERDISFSDSLRLSAGGSGAPEVRAAQHSCSHLKATRAQQTPTPTVHRERSLKAFQRYSHVQPVEKVMRTSPGRRSPLDTWSVTPVPGFQGAHTDSIIQPQGQRRVDRTGPKSSEGIMAALAKLATMALLMGAVTGVRPALLDAAAVALS